MVARTDTLNPLTADAREFEGKALRAQLARSTRLEKAKALLLVLPLLLFIGIMFIFPLADMMLRSTDNGPVAELMPDTATRLLDWDQSTLPDEAIYAALARDIQTAQKERTLGKIATRLNFELSGIRSLLTKSARKLAQMESSDESWKQRLVQIDQRWGELATWSAIKRVLPSVTATFYLSSLDLAYDAKGEVVRKPPERAIYVDNFIKTFAISLGVTLSCFILGFPVAYLLSVLPTAKANLLMICVLLPFWTSLLVRTTSWIALLQTHGIVNDLLVWLGILNEGNRLDMMYNMFGTVVAMTHILLPFMILPLFSVMKSIDPSFMRAATSLGASPFTAFIRVYLPQTKPGIAAGSLLVFILAIGYYITPALVGGRTGQMISNFIAYHMQQSLNWGLAAALAVILLIIVLILYWLFNRIIGIDKLKLG
ncbi:ABC transporter permease [Sedimenticola hydrogenitrophicus]|uniref:ABC transporter permease n=1 Tax=Sedimenticola hydrogenitrophicus TaxID=2967975 RepID=UPI0021A8ABCC|nr:ABC transporter permease [Sedimenticola hydrogenitrophicus]